MAKQDPVDLRALRGVTKTRWAWTVGTVFGVGLLRPGPGTYGSVVTVLGWYAAAHGLHPDAQTLALGTVLAALAVTILGIPAATIVARESGREDPGHVVVDEVAGQLIALIAMPADWQHAAIALLLFRLFDIVKPPPVRQMEQLPEGTGVMLDDVAAGVLALITGQIVRRFLF